MKAGTILRNNWASDDNPIRFFIYTGVSGQSATGIHYYDGKLEKVRYHKADLKSEMFEVVGYCNAFDIMKKDLKTLQNK